MPIAKSSRESVASRFRAHELASDQRAGAWSRRQVRASQRAWLQRHWRIVAGFVVVAALLSGVAEWFLPPSVRGYVVGALLASAVWGMYHVMIASAGLTGKLAGIDSEVLTATEFRRLRRSGWRLVNHVMLENRDVDHVAVGPGGFFAVETKYRSKWLNLDRDVATFTAMAREDADDVWLRLGVPPTKVRSLVVLYGGGIGEMRPQPFEVDGVTFCSGTGLRAYLRTVADGDVPDDEVAKAYAKLESNVRPRDRREIASGGVIPRQAVDGVQDLVAVSVSATVALLIISLAMTLTTSILWAVPAAAAIVGVAVWLRRTLPTSLRVQRSTTATVTAAGFLGTLTFVAWLVEIFQR